MQTFCIKIKSCSEQMLPNLSQRKPEIQHESKFSFLFVLTFLLVIYYCRHPAILSEPSFITLLFSFGPAKTSIPAGMHQDQVPSPPSRLVLSCTAACLGGWERAEPTQGEKNNERQLLNKFTS